MYSPHIANAVPASVNTKNSRSRMAASKRGTHLFFHDHDIAVGVDTAKGDIDLENILCILRDEARDCCAPSM